MASFLDTFFFKVQLALLFSFTLANFTPGNGGKRGILIDLNLPASEAADPIFEWTSSQQDILQELTRSSKGSCLSTNDPNDKRISLQNKPGSDLDLRSQYREQSSKPEVSSSKRKTREFLTGSSSSKRQKGSVRKNIVVQEAGSKATSRLPQDHTNSVRTQHSTELTKLRLREPDPTKTNLPSHQYQNLILSTNLVEGQPIDVAPEDEALRYDTSNVPVPLVHIHSSVEWFLSLDPNSSKWPRPPVNWKKTIKPIFIQAFQMLRQIRSAGILQLRDTTKTGLHVLFNGGTESLHEIILAQKSQFKLWHMRKRTDPTSAECSHETNMAPSSQKKLPRKSRSKKSPSERLARSERFSFLHFKSLALWREEVQDHKLRNRYNAISGAREVEHQRRALVSFYALWGGEREVKACKEDCLSGIRDSLEGVNLDSPEARETVEAFPAFVHLNRMAHKYYNRHNEQDLEEEIVPDSWKFVKLYIRAVCEKNQKSIKEKNQEYIELYSIPSEDQDRLTDLWEEYFYRISQKDRIKRFIAVYVLFEIYNLRLKGEDCFKGNISTALRGFINHGIIYETLKLFYNS